jgi:hypothetical protein
MRFHEISVNQSVFTEANRGLTSYTIFVFLLSLAWLITPRVQ